jgi:hypothetical protein
MAGIPDEQFLVDADGKRKGVLLSIERYEQLTEDLHDLAVVAERRAEEPISFDVMLLGSKKMASFSLDFKPSIEKDLRRLPRDIVLRPVSAPGASRCPTWVSGPGRKRPPCVGSAYGS